MLSIIILLSLLPNAEAAKSNLPKELSDFLGTPPAHFQKKILAPSLKIKKARDLKQAGDLDGAIAELKAVLKTGDMQEHAAYELAATYREKKDFAKSNFQLLRLQSEFPSNPYSESVKDQIFENDCDGALAAADASGRKRGANDLFKCLYHFSWKEWNNREPQVVALYEVLKNAKDPLFKPFVAELLQAFSPGSKIRARIGKDLSSEEISSLSTPAKLRLRTSQPAGVKPAYLDAEFFDEGMQLVVSGKWKEAKGTFEKFLSEFPTSEHIDRANYWIARCDESLGNSDLAKKEFGDIFEDAPLSYYGLQAALHLNKDLKSYITNTENTSVKIRGTLFTRQAKSLWRVRALLEAGLFDHARDEAEYLFQSRPGGYTFGQDTPDGAILVSLLYSIAGYHQGAFQHGYAAVNLKNSYLGKSLGMVFPPAFKSEFEKAAESTGINPFLLLSLTKQESAFKANAISKSDAFGLMQLIYPTAKEVDLEATKPRLFEPEYNIQLGSKYLQKLLEKFQGNIALALAGYNAGPNRAAQWQKRSVEGGSKSIDIFIDTIPFTETRKYVGSILRNYAWYRLANNDTQQLTSIQDLAFQWQKTKPAAVADETQKLEEKIAPKVEEKTPPVEIPANKPQEVAPAPLPTEPSKP